MQVYILYLLRELNAIAYVSLVVVNAKQSCQILTFFTKHTTSQWQELEN